MAVDTPAGLVVPVIRDVDAKSIWELAGEVSAKAVAMKACSERENPMAECMVASEGNGERGPSHA